MTSGLSSTATTPALSRTSTASDASCDSNASTLGIYTPSDLSRQSSIAGGDIRAAGGRGHASSMDPDSSLDVQELDGCLETLEGSSSLRMSVRSAMRKAGILVKNKLSVSKSLKNRRSGILSFASTDDCSSISSIAEVDEDRTLDPTFTPQTTPDIPSICVQDMGTPDTGMESSTTPRAGDANTARASPDILASAYPFALNPDDNANVSAISLLAVCGTPVVVTEDEVDSVSFASKPWVRLISIPIRIAFFVPWCALVGALIVLAPLHVHKVTPSAPHTVWPTIPAPSTRRFAYWGECALYHILIFCAAILCTMIWIPTRVIAAVLPLMVTRSYWIWKEFVMGMKQRNSGPVSLGEDDMESVYLALTNRHLQDGYQLLVENEVVTMKDSLSVLESLMGRDIDEDVVQTD